MGSDKRNSFHSINFNYYLFYETRKMLHHYCHKYFTNEKVSFTVDFQLNKIFQTTIYLKFIQQPWSTILSNKIKNILHLVKKRFYILISVWNLPVVLSSSIIQNFKFLFQNPFSCSQQFPIFIIQFYSSIRIFSTIMCICLNLDV